MKILGLLSVMVALGMSSFGCSSSSSAAPPPGGGAPSVSISSPASGGSVTLAPPQDNVSIAFALSNFTLKAPGSCAGATNCGHLHVLVDGPACTPAGAPYNNDAESSPATAILSKCPMANGAHTATLEIHNDDHSPFLGSDGKVISTSVAFTASGG